MAREKKNIGISLGSHKENKRKYEDPSKKMVRKSNKKRVAETGKRVVKLGHYPTIKATLGL